MLWADKYNIMMLYGGRGLTVEENPVLDVTFPVVVQGDLWFGKGNVPYVMGLQKQVDAQKAANARRSLEEGQVRLVRGVFRVK